jgi:hypothetical protein
MGKKEKEETFVFEVVVVLSIVAIVAITAQVLLNSPQVSDQSNNMITGQVVAEESLEEIQLIHDIAISEIKIDPETPLVAEPFKIFIEVENKGTEIIEKPFYVSSKVFLPGEKEPLVFDSLVTEIIAPGETSTVNFKLATVTSEGALKIQSTADSTSKYEDLNLANNKLSKTTTITLY